MSTLVQQFRAARRVATPLICVRTPDPAATVALLVANVAPDAPVLQWDCIRGLCAINASGKDEPSEHSVKAITAISSDSEELRGMNIIRLLKSAADLPKSSVVFLLNAQRFMETPVIQGIWNLRDIFKANRRTLVMLCPSMTLPEELSDVRVLDEPLPNSEQLATILKEQYTAATTIKDSNLPELKDSTIAKAVDATCGLSAFSAEQAIAESLTKTGLDLNGLWERKRATIEQTPGLSVLKSDLSFTELKDLDNAANFLRRWLNGKDASRGILFMDEIEKSLAGISGDNTGVSQDMFGEILRWMQDSEADGMLMLGHAGCGKTAVGKAAGSEAGIPVIKFDIGGMKSSHVGDSEARIRNGFKVADAVCQGRILVLATCNKIDILPPELRSRFAVTMFFDLLSEEGRRDCWSLYKKKYNLDPRDKPPDSENWTGREIWKCCKFAYKMNCSLLEAAKYIVPISISSPEKIESLRALAHGRFVSASKDGLYRYDKTKAAIATGRAFSLEE